MSAGIPGRDDPQTVDVCVIGAGPAGAAASALLARWGHRVALVHHEARHPGIAESLPASTRKVFALAGLLDVLEGEGFEANVGNVSHWAGVRQTTSSDAAGYHVPRHRFDRALRAFAVTSGVIDVAARVRDVVAEEPWRVVCERAGDREACEYRARFVIDCSGRAGVVGRRMFERLGEGYRTLAFIAEWAVANWSDDEVIRTTIESYEDGWAWSVPIEANRRQCTVMIDPDRTVRVGQRLADAYACEIRKAVGLAERLRASTRLSRVWPCDATVYHSTRCAEGHLLLVGDAASVVEPLSSSGVRKAVTSAWRAAVVVNTALRDSSMLADGLAFFEGRERAMYRSCVQQAHEHFSAAARYHQSEFWRVREQAGSAFAAVPGASDESAATRDAFARVRQTSPVVRFVAGGQLRFAWAPDISGSVLIRREGILLPGVDEPRIYQGGVRLAPLSRVATHSTGVHEVIARYEASEGEARPDEILSALSLLVGHGVLTLSEPDTVTAPPESRVAP